MSPDPGPPSPPPYTLRTPDLFASVPLAAAQSTPTGQEIHRLRAWSGRLYVAYGDYGANTGPIHLPSFDLTTGAAHDEATLHTEATWVFRPTSLGLVVPYVDPQGIDDATQGQYALVTTPGAVTVATNVTPTVVHTMDAVESPDGLFLSGASDLPDGGLIWRSTDGGTTWAQSLSVPAAADAAARVYALCRLGDDLLATYDDGGTTRTLYHWAAGGSSWTLVGACSAVSDLIPFTWQGIPFALGVPTGKQLGRAAFGGTPVVLTLPVDAADQAAIAATLPDVQVQDAATDGVHLWLLANNVVWEGTTAGTWTALFQLTVGVRSIEVTATAIYLGTADGRVLTVAR